MQITLADWHLHVDVEQTMLHSMNCASDHCQCAYCRNYYETVDLAHPTLRQFLERFGVQIEGPSEVMPLKPTLVITCYRVIGEIMRVGTARMHVDNVPIRPAVSDNGSFLLWVGPLTLPWNQAEPMEDVVSPANQPEFLERMRSVYWMLLDEAEIILNFN